jgi:O-antigen/teichoic acid export membrane protein
VPRNFLWALAGNLLSGATSWGTFIVLAKVSSPELVGQYSLGLAVVLPLGFLTDLHLRATLGTDTQQQFPFGDYLRLRLTTCAVLLLAVAVALLAAEYSPEVRLVILASGVAKAVESVIDVFYGLFQQHERMDQVARSLLVRGPLSLAVLAGVVAATQNMAWGGAALALVRLLCLLGHDVPTGLHTLRAGPASAGKRPAFRAKLLALGRLAWLTLPLGFVMMLIALNTSIPQYFVEHYRGSRELGYFGALVSLAGGGGVLIAAAGQAAGPRLARAFAAEDFRLFRRLLLSLVLLGFGLGSLAVVGVLLVGRPVLRLVYQPEYAEYSAVLAWLIFAITLDHVASFLGWGILATRRFHQYPVPYILTTGIVVGASWLLVPRFGLVGAAWAIAAANGVSFVVLLAILAATLRRSRVSPKKPGF